MGKKSKREDRLSVSNRSVHSTTIEEITKTSKEDKKIDAILGLDISSSVVGICILEKETPNKLILLDYVKLTSSKLKNEYDKAEIVENHFQHLMTSLEDYKIDKIFIEDAAKRFTPGLSSANTISTLCRFNGITSYIVYKLFDIKPKMINVRSARKVLGIHINQKIKKTTSPKQQVFNFVKQLLSSADTKWPTHLAKTGKSKGKIVFDGVGEDMSDAFVVCKGGILLP